MILDVHVAFLVASLFVLFGLTYTIGQLLDHKICEAQKRRENTDMSLGDTEALNS